MVNDFAETTKETRKFEKDETMAYQYQTLLRQEIKKEIESQHKQACEF
jgi:hypothetical protein